MIIIIQNNSIILKSSLVPIWSEFTAPELTPGNNGCVSVTAVSLFLMFYLSEIMICSLHVSFCLIKHDAFEIYL